jgi:hypothetical protein
MSVVCELSGLIFTRQLSVKLLSSLAKGEKEALMDDVRMLTSASARRCTGD